MFINYNRTMSWNYKPKLFDPKSDLPFKLSRSKIDLYIQCPRCFYFDRRLGVAKPSMPGWPLNSAVDYLLKKEFDIHRAKNQQHPLMEKYHIDAVPFDHEKMNVWRENFTGIQYLHPKTNFLITGAIDDLWQKKNGELIIVDYKSTSTQEEITLEGQWKEGYKRQMEIYQWLFRQNKFKVSKTGYFVYANASKENEAFDAKLEFDIQLIPYEGDDSWVEKTIIDAKKCLMKNELPEAAADCEYCNYRNLAKEKEKPILGKSKQDKLF